MLNKMFSRHSKRGFKVLDQDTIWTLMGVHSIDISGRCILMINNNLQTIIQDLHFFSIGMDISVPMFCSK